MQEEPELIDIIAIVALPAIINAFRGEDCESCAETAYEYAAEMLIARQKYVLPSCNQRVNKPRGKKSSTSE